MPARRHIRDPDTFGVLRLGHGATFCIGSPLPTLDRRSRKVRRPDVEIPFTYKAIWGWIRLQSWRTCTTTGPGIGISLVAIVLDEL
jgi:hypothetical protein